MSATQTPCRKTLQGKEFTVLQLCPFYLPSTKRWQYSLHHPPQNNPPSGEHICQLAIDTQFSFSDTHTRSYMSFHHAEQKESYTHMIYVGFFIIAAAKVQINDPQIIIVVYVANSRKLLAKRPAKKPIVNFENFSSVENMFTIITTSTIYLTFAFSIDLLNTL